MFQMQIITAFPIKYVRIKLMTNCGLWAKSG